MSSLETVTIYNLSLPKRFSYRQLDAVMIFKLKQRIKQRKCSEVPVDRAEISLVNTPHRLPGSYEHAQYVITSPTAGADTAQSLK